MSSFYRNAHSVSKKPITKLTTRDEHVDTSVKFSHTSYTKADVNDVAVLIVFFNPTQSVRIIQNLLYVKSLFEAAAIPAFYGELAFQDNPFVLSSASNVFQWRSTSYMFYKENLIVQLEKLVPNTYTKLCILDADIVFKNKDWYKKLSELLDTYTIVQPFSEAYLLDLSFKLESKKASCLKEKNGHCGFGWAFQRPWFQRNPLYEYALIGGGDSFFGEQLHLVEKWPSAYTDDLSKLPEIEAHTKTFLDTVVYHLPHGKRSNRQFMTRHEVLKKQLGVLGVPNLKAIVFRDSNGILAWKPEYSKAMNELLLTYFTQREDDGV